MHNFSISWFICAALFLTLLTFMSITFGFLKVIQIRDRLILTHLVMVTSPLAGCVLSLRTLALICLRLICLLASTLFRDRFLLLTHIFKEIPSS